MTGGAFGDNCKKREKMAGISFGRNRRRERMKKWRGEAFSGNCAKENEEMKKRNETSLRLEAEKSRKIVGKGKKKKNEKRRKSPSAKTAKEEKRRRRQLTIASTGQRPLSRSLLLASLACANSAPIRFAERACRLSVC